MGAAVVAPTVCSVVAGQSRVGRTNRLSRRRSKRATGGRLYTRIAVGKRQVPIAGYIVDLLVPCTKLIIEVDGSSHVKCTGAGVRRDRKLESLG